MTGFIKGLFGKKDDNQPKEAFFLDADSASSLGDVNFMRKSKTVKRSYPKAAGKINDIEGETEKSVSSMKKQENAVEAKPSSYSSSYTPSTSTSSFTQPSKFTSTSPKIRNSNNSSDGIDFKSMARNINKKR
ncbi:MAG: hypothetical protein O4861_23125 [Trichodesmium sp. St16_bin4-tuft]|nr:hypothetical protein [Trichodesmium sp. MAG_R01]MDE5068236.1 hypothetical protein [Trichodesmium sp. St4_bin8_1]MDE5070890.1 hypothetical protein [Trichodesmium sp. St5_bin8]MDE5076867.1 hypothetical protein [Trichodesmium sp. St2_bin6]MDE5101064.1 hypothetical protein [Trichodesmium sp. St16_bin4-tuft]MDE5102375.1 hypothetical protein [Trichodesmium sp. St19_bin2]